MEVVFVNNSKEVSIPTKRLDFFNNSFSLSFNSDDEARQNEEILKKANYKTIHTENSVRVLNAQDFYMFVKD